MSAHVPSWVRDAVFYQIFPDRFAASARVPKPGPLEPWDTPPTRSGFKGGDLLGIAERLDELADLGVTALYLTPVFASASNHRYHTYDYFAVDPLLGGTPALRELTDALHARGMRIVLDGVFNHTGRGFWPFHHVVETGASSPYVDWFHFDRERLAAGRGVQPYPGRGPRAAAGAGETRDRKHETGYAAWWDLPALPKLNTGHPPVREFILSVAEHWLRFGIDGWRLDVPYEIEDPGFWAEFRRRCRAANPDAYLVGEIWSLAPEWVSDRCFDALMNYPLQKALLAFAGGPVIDRDVLGFHPDFSRKLQPIDGALFAAALNETLAAYPPEHVAAQLNLLSSHDVPRFRTIAGGDAAAFRLATLLQMTLPGAPCVYYGDEVGMEGRADPDCRRAFPRPGGPRDEGVRTTVRALIAARAAHPALRADRVRVAAAAGGMVLLERGGTDDPLARAGTLLVGANAGTTPAACEAVLPALAGRTAVPLVLPGFEPAAPFAVGAAGEARVTLPARGGAIWGV